MPDAVNAYLSAPDFLAAQARQLPAVRIKALEDIGCALGSERPSSVEDCVRWARLKFEALFVHDIKQLLHNFPPGAAGAGGEPFWSGAKRCPAPAAFDAAEPTCAAFVAAAASLRAAVYGLKLGARHDAAFFAATAAAVPVPAWAPAAGLRIAANDKELEEMKREAEAAAEAAAAAAAAAAAIVAARAPLEAAAPAMWHGRRLRAPPWALRPRAP